MTKFNFYQNAEKLILTKEFSNMKEADKYVKENFQNYWNIEIRKAN